MFWGVLHQAGTRQAIRQIVPEATQFPQAGKLVNKLNGMVIGIEGSSDLEAHFQLISSAPDDAATNAQLLQAGVLLKQFEARNSDPELSALLSSVRMVPNGEGLEVSFSVSTDQVVSLIKKILFQRSAETPGIAISYRAGPSNWRSCRAKPAVSPSIPRA